MHLLNKREITDDHNEIHVTEDQAVRESKLEMWIAKQVGEHLVKVYPSRQWGVLVDVPGEMIAIMCPSVSLNKGYHLAMKGDTIAVLQERAVKAAGEILERYGLSRERHFDPDTAESLPRLSLNPDEAITADSDGVDPIKRNG